MVSFYLIRVIKILKYILTREKVFENNSFIVFKIKYIKFGYKNIKVPLNSYNKKNFSATSKLNN